MTTLLVTAQPLLGISAATLSVLAFFPYIINVLRGQTVPQRATWIVWAVLASISASAQLTSGDSQALGFAVVQAAATILIALLALANGTRHRLSALERFTLFGAALGLAAWLITDTPIYALAIAIGLSALGAIPTILKTYANPASETLTSWALLLIASLLAILAVGRADPVMLAYPVYLALLYSAILTAAALGKRRTVSPAVAVS